MDSNAIGLAVAGGLGCGALARYIFTRLLREDRVGPMKDEMRRLRRATMDPEIDPGEAMRLGLANLKLSMAVLGLSLLPSLASTVPALIFLFGLRTALHTTEDWPFWQTAFMIAAVVSHLGLKVILDRIRQHEPRKLRES